jgi:hypothetical protein
MNTTSITSAPERTRTSLEHVCATLCQDVKARLALAKLAVLNEARLTLKAPRHLVELAVNEAEVTAWQTGYPLLAFPTLAAEKVRAVAKWNYPPLALPRNNPPALYRVRSS